jgi:hypothetical protein
MNTRRPKPPALLPTLEQGAYLTLHGIAAIYALDEALDPKTDAEKAFLVQCVAGPHFRVSAKALRTVFGARRAKR